MDNTPSDSFAEQAVLGACLVDKKWAITASKLKESDFTVSQHRCLFKAVQKMLEEKKENIDVVSIWEYIKETKEFEDLGGRQYALTLTNVVPTFNHTETYIDKLRHLSVLRDVIRISQFAIIKAQENGADSTKVLDETQVELTKLAETGSFDQIVTVGEVLLCSTEVLQKVRQNEKYVVGFPTGFLDVDEFTSGLQPGNFMIIAGRPSMGKTAFALNMAEKMARDHALPSLFVSLEMGKTEIGFRLLSSSTKLPLKSIKKADLKDTQWTQLEQSVMKLKDCPLYFDFSTSPDISDIRATARKWMYEMQKKNQRLAAIFVDYLQLMSCRSMNNREQEIAYISRSLKSLARELEVPVVALSQLNRKPEERGRQGIPQLSDLRESGALEQDADVVCALYRPIVYSKDEKHRGMAKLIMMKQRNGPIGDIPLIFDENCVTFDSVQGKVDYDL